MGTRNPTAANPDLGNPEAASNDTVFPALPSANATEAMPRAVEPADVPAFPAPAAPSPGISVEGSATEALLPEAAPAPAAAPAESEPPTTESAAPVPAEVAPAAPLPIGSPDESVTSAVIPAADASDDPFDVVRVFYGTDRRPVLLNEDSLLSRLIRFLPSMILIALSVIGIGVVLVSRKITWTIGTTALVILSVLSTWHGVSETIAIAEQAHLEEPKYSADRSDRGRIDRGICEVSIPKTHDPGELESPTILRLETRFDPAKHITLRKTIRLQDRAFYDQIREQVARSPDREILVFVHGFNVSFEDAARRTAQMAHDLKLQGAPVFFSWPADRGFLLTYGKDEASVSWATPHLKEFLLDLVHETDAKAINLVAHSMGNRALTTALREIDLQMRSEAKLFNQVVLAAPDIDADDFRDNIAPAIQRTAKQVTLYASANDAALAASYYVHRNPRAGDASRGLVIAPGIVTIDVSNIDGGPWGHSYYGASDPVLRDLHLLLTSLPPERRTWLKMNQVDGQTYWAFKPLGTARTPAVMEPR